MKQNYSFATYYRVLGMFFILLCHFTQQSKNIYLNVSAQLFNIGVEMFIILSGFLFGTRERGECSTIRWLKKRTKRIFIPYELFAFVLFIIHLSCGKNVLKMDWVWLFLGIQGSIVGVQGAEQTWFITSMLLCYLCTPLFEKCCEASIQRRRIVIGTLIVLPAMLALMPPAHIRTVFSPICWYGLAFFAGNEAKGIRIRAKGAVCSLLIMCASFAIRLFARMVIDGTILYDRIVASYTHVLAAFAMFYLIAFLTKERQTGRCLHFLSSISFEVYLYHYLFCVGPVRLFSLTGNWLVECCVITIITVLIAYFMKKASDTIAKRI